MPDAAILDAGQRAFAAAARTATLATVRPDGLPRLVPICFVIGPDDPDRSARLYSPLDDKPKSVSDPRRLARIRDLLADPRATVLVDRWSEDWDRLGWLRLDVIGDLLEPDLAGRVEHAAAVEALRAKYPQYASHGLEERPILRFAILRAVSWGRLEVE